MARSTKPAAGGQKRPWWKRWWAALLVLPALALGAIGLLLFFVVFSSVPLPEDIAAIASTVYDAEGEEVGGLSAEANQEIIEFDEIPEHTRQAVMAAEDRGFYDHNGISATGIARALFTNVRGGGVQQGGSTITQQYIKNVALTPEQTYTRKVQEAALAIKLERAYEKDEILGFYLNSIYWGRGAIGIESAAQVYFGIDASELNTNQSALLAGLIAAPEAWDPAENPERADQRRVFALDGMLEQGWITEEQHDELVAGGMPNVVERSAIDLGPNAYYLDAVRRVLTNRPEFQGGELYRGLRVHTQLDPRMQEAAQEELTRAVEEGPTDTGAIVTIDPRTGGVRALVGGPDAREQSLNTALVSPRQPGSAFKAFTLQAFTEAGNSPETRFPAPAEMDYEDVDGSVRNFGGTAYGEQTVYQATASSTNTVYYQMQEEAGRERVIEAAARAGLPTEKREELYPTEETLRPGGPTMEPHPSLTLGSEEFTPLEMATAFGTYAAEGLHVTPHLVSRVEDADGNVVWEQRVEEDQNVDLNVSRVVTQGLRGVVTSGTGTAADIGRPAAGKTGTTTDSKDAWFVGYVPQLVTSVWLGNLDATPIEGDQGGGAIAAPLWGSYMARAVEGLEVEDFVAPDLSELEGGQPEEPESCPEGYRFAEPPTEADEDGFFPDVLTDVRDEQGRPCVEVKPEPEEEPECPEGYAFAEPPAPDADPQPEVLTDITDAEGRPCVEQDPEPEPEPTETEPTDDDGDADDGTADDGTTDDGTADDGTTDDGTTDDGTTDDGTTDDGATDGGGGGQTDGGGGGGGQTDGGGGGGQTDDGGGG